MTTTGEAWPAIRAPLRDGWQAPAADGVRRSQMDDGSVKRRVVSSALGATESFVFKLAPDQAELLDEHYAANKALRFAFPHPVWGDVEACYDGAPVFSEVGLFRRIAVRLEIFR